MSEITKVNTGAVLQNAESILSEAAAFKAAFDAMYDTIHDLNKTFTSADGKAYIAKIDGYQGDFTYEIHNFSKGFDAGFHQETVTFARKLGQYMVTLM